MDSAGLFVLVTLFLPRGLLGLALTTPRERAPTPETPALAVEEGAEP